MRNSKRILASKYSKLSAERIELSFQDDVRGAVAKAEQALQQANKTYDNAFTDIRRIEKIVENFGYQPSDLQKKQQEFSKQVQKIEKAYQDAIQQFRNAEQELEVEIKRPQWMSAAVTILEKMQREEELLRKEANEFSASYKKYVR